MRHNIKAMFFDIDDTLRSFSTSRVPDSAVEALLWAREKGIKLFLATGRHAGEIKKMKQLAEIGFDGTVAMTGQYCYCGDEVIFQNPIPTEDVAKAVTYVQETGSPCLFMEAERMYVSALNWVVKEVHAGDLSVPPVEDVRRALDHDIFQICLYTEDNEVPSVVETLVGCTYTQWYSNGLDIVPKTGNKWVGIEKMLARFDLLPEEVACFGDSGNDIEMLKNGGFSIAMGNAMEHVKLVADYVTDHIDQNGLANGIHYLLDGRFTAEIG